VPTTASLLTTTGISNDSVVGSKVLICLECSFCAGLVCNPTVGIFCQSKMVSCRSRLSAVAFAISCFTILTADLALPLFWLLYGNDVVWVLYLTCQLYTSVTPDNTSPLDCIFVAIGLSTATVWEH